MALTICGWSDGYNVSNYRHQLAILCDNSVVGWGDNTYNQLGNPASHISTYLSTNAIPVIFPTPTKILSVATTYYSSAAVDEDGQVWIWGGDITSNNPPLPFTGTTVPVLLNYSGSPINNAIQVAGGDQHILILLRDGSVLGYGSGFAGQLGNGTYASTNTALKVKTTSTTDLSDIAFIAAGGSHSLALDISGNIFSWGANGNGQLGLGNQGSPVVYATECTTITDVSAIAAGEQHSLCISIGQAYGWGLNDDYQSGQTSLGTSYNSPQLISFPSGTKSIIQIYSGQKHSLAQSDDNKLYGWGDNSRWQLAINPNSTSLNRSLPIEISNGQNDAELLDNFKISCDNDINYCYLNYTVSGSESWPNISQPTCYANSILIKEVLFIPKSCTLDITNMTIIFGPNGRIILEVGSGSDAGAQLILNNATLTAAGDCMWKGIEVRGNAAVNSDNSWQAKVTINTGSLIENAHNAVTLGRWDEGYYACFESQPIVDPSGFDLTGSGGQIECDDATFQNNATDIRFAPYTRLSASTIENSHFLGGQLRDNRYGSTSTLPFNIFYARKNNSQRAVYGIRQWQNFIVEIEGNDFEDYEEAIFLTASRLRIIGNDFTNCRMGINSISTVSVLIYGGEVEGNTFNNIRIHINAGGGRYLNISNQNEFNPNAASQASNLCAINLNNETAFDIVDNNFTSLRFGIVSNNSGVSGGLIRYRLGPDGNLFTDCWRSIQMQGNNGNLRIKCNTYNNVGGGASYNTNWFLNLGGTLANQGFFSSTRQTVQAGNWFEQELIRNELSSFSTNQFTYFRHGAGSPDEVIPAVAGLGMINIDATSIAMSTFDEACDPIVIPTNGEPDRLAFYENVIDSLNLEMDTLVGSIDNQFTDSLVAIIDNFYPQDTILDRLRSNGPLSDTVLIKAINTVDALDDYAVYEVLFVNSPYSEEVLNSLNGRDPEIDEGMREALNLVHGINPPYTTITSLNKEIDYYKGDKRLLINSYVTRLSSQDSVQKAIQVLEAENSYEDRQTVFGTYITMGELDSAATKLELLLTSGLAEADWLELSEILLSLTSEGKTWFDMSDIEANVLREIATQEENTLAKIQSQNVLHLVYGDTFPVMIDDEEIYLRQMEKPKEDTKFAFENNKFQLYPNPANDNVEIRLSNNKEFISYIVLINNLGNIVLNQKTGEKQSACQLNTSQLPSGLYLMKVNVTSGPTYSNKLMIVK